MARPIRGRRGGHEGEGGRPRQRGGQRRRSGGARGPSAGGMSAGPPGAAARGARCQCQAGPDSPRVGQPAEQVRCVHHVELAEGSGVKRAGVALDELAARGVDVRRHAGGGGGLEHALDRVAVRLARGNRLRAIGGGAGRSAGGRRMVGGEGLAAGALGLWPAGARHTGGLGKTRGLTASATAASTNFWLKSTPTTSWHARAISNEERPTAQPTSRARSFAPANAGVLRSSSTQMSAVLRAQSAAKTTQPGHEGGGANDQRLVVVGRAIQSG